MTAADDLIQEWRQRLQQDCPDQGQAIRDSMVQWLVGETPEQLNHLAADELAIVKQALDYRYRILRQRYWGISADVAYQRLLRRLSSLFLIRSKIRTWIALSRDRKRTVQDVLQEVLQDMLQSDRHLRQQITWVARCSRQSWLRNLLTLATLEEYCLRPIRNQPLVVYRFVNYLRRSQKAGMTQVPTGELVRLVSDEVATDDPEASLSLLDVQALFHYQEQAAMTEQQILRAQVKQEFMTYLSQKLDHTATRWLELHLQGCSQDTIAQRLNLPVRQVYRLREKISYHAVRVFTLKEQPELVLNWLKISPSEHNLGLTPTQWEQFWASCNDLQRQIIEQFKQGQSIDAIAQQLNLSPKQVQSEWAQLYLEAQGWRSRTNESNG
ncbi:hypothetical protein XM38_051640 [Halomicronema hongdechloris C2206]|uniref:HetZ-related protein 2 n=1 Tax=Halomicronema hongdechloris C2206 TaxID=1641165 RepID=A0A1Z3HV65_9CYAN|nr:HetZ-related protein 2 [Halomicronema hongdechloris]ASC74189.1 hypothetical protein XM38_051640 [Halomicronema hongdechloris C2206]